MNVPDATWMDHAATVLRDNAVQLDFPQFCAIKNLDLSSSVARKKAAQRWKKDVMKPAVEWFAQQLAAHANNITERG